MSKAVLVMEMPPVCLVCPCCSDREECNVVNKDIDVDAFDSKPNWCPLKSLPEKKELKAAKTMTDLGWVEGWNACLDEITKERE